MPTASIDHIAIPTANAERLIAFYKRLGFPINNEEAWRAGTAPTFSIQVGEYSKINVHPEGFTASLRGPRSLRCSRIIRKIISTASSTNTTGKGSSDHHSGVTSVLMLTAPAL